MTPDVVCWLFLVAIVVVAIGTVRSLLVFLLSPRGHPDVDP